jgi:AcrR family transcriptional regulator
MDDEDRILNAASALISERGSRMTLDEVIVRAEVHPSAVYRRWRSSSELAAELVRRETVNIPTVDGQSDVGAALLDVVTRLASSLERNRVLLENLAGASSREPELAVELRLFLHAWISTVRETIVRASQGGEALTTPNLDWVAELVCSTVWFRVVAQGQPGIDKHPESIVDPIMKIAR